MDLLQPVGGSFRLFPYITIFADTGTALFALPVRKALELSVSFARLVWSLKVQNKSAGAHFMVLSSVIVAVQSQAP